MADDVRIEEFHGDREELRDLFVLAEDSTEQLDRYLRDGRVLVARRDGIELRDRVWLDQLL